MLREMTGPHALADILADRRFNAVVLGAALGVGEETRALVRVALEAGRAVVKAATPTAWSGFPKRRVCWSSSGTSPTVPRPSCMRAPITPRLQPER